MRSTMVDLIAELEAAPEGSRELDCRIWVELNGKGQPMKTVGEPTYEKPRLFCNPNPEIPWIGYDLLNIVDPYTSSLDAARTLLLPGWGWLVEEWQNEKAWAQVVQRPEGSTTPSGIFEGAEGATPELALCIARLKSENTEGQSQ